MGRRAAAGVGSKQQQRGQATVELALALPVAILIGLVGLQAGLVAVDAIKVQHAAREAARAAAVDPTAAVARSAAQGAAALDDGAMSVSLGGGGESGQQLSVVVTYQAPTDVPLVGALVGSISLRSEVTMRVE